MITKIRSKLEEVTGGLIAHPFDAAPELLRFYRWEPLDVHGPTPSQMRGHPDA